jgi:predicted metal-dependent phosphotriesterase family hydrolase
MTSSVSTVLGDIPSSDLGITMIHEHFALALSPTQTVDDMPNLTQEINDLASLGCRTVVELSNIGMGRDVTRLVQLAKATGMHIIAATGFYTQPWHPAWVADCSVEDLTTLMVKEIEQGIDGTEVCAGVIGEIGTSEGTIHPDEEKALRAACRAHLETGRPISTHCQLGHLSRQQLDIIEQEGVDTRYVVIGHLDLTPNIDEVLEVAQRGAFVELDTFGKEAYQSDENRMQRLLQLVEAGFTKSIVVSVDISRNSYMKAYGGYGYDHFLAKIVPELKRRGLDDAALQTILVDNPRRFLEGSHA